MKKYLLKGLCVVICISMIAAMSVACKSNDYSKDEDSDEKTSDRDNDEEDDEDDEDEESEENRNQEPTEPETPEKSIVPEETDDPTTSIPREDDEFVMREPRTPVNIEEQVIYDADGVTATALSYTTAESAYGMDVLDYEVTNQSDTDIVFDIAGVAANGIMTTNESNVTVPAGETVQDYVYLSIEDNDITSINTVGEVLLYIEVLDAYSYGLIGNETASVITDGYDDKDYSFSAIGTTIYDENGFSVIVGEGEWSQDLYCIEIYCMNDSDDIFMTYCDSVKINGNDDFSVYAQTILGGTNGYTYLFVMADSLEALGIAREDLETISFSIEILDYVNNCEVIATSEEYVHQVA